MSIAPIGVFGGTFDPIHFGHLRLAQEIVESVRMAEVRFMPGGTPPHRAAPQVTAQQRMEMVLLATAGNPLFTVDGREVSRTGPGYTVDTLTELRREIGDKRPLCLLLGADAFIVEFYLQRTVRIVRKYVVKNLLHVGANGFAMVAVVGFVPGAVTANNNPFHIRLICIC